MTFGDNVWRREESFRRSCGIRTAGTQRLRAENVEGLGEPRRGEDVSYSVDIPLVPQLARGRWYGLEQVEPLGKIDLKARQGF